MAGDWLKIEKITPDKPEIEAIATLLDLDPDAVFGKCFRVWRWFDDHTTDGNAQSVTRTSIDRRIGVTGFASAMESVGWLASSPDGLMLPKFDRHNGETSKARALTAKRVAKHKSQCNAKSNDEVTVGALPREEKRREEELKTHASGDNLTGMYLRTPLFEEFIRVYPRASAPEAAWVEWQGKVFTEGQRHGKPDAEIEEMIVKAAREFRDSPAGKPPDGSQDYRPAAAKWLQGNCWEEPRELWQQPNGKSTTRSKQPAKPTIKPIPKETRSPNQVVQDALDQLNKMEMP